MTAAGSSLLLVACAAPQISEPPRSGYLDVSGGRLYYERVGNGPPLILLHGFALDRREWDGQFNALSASYQVIRYDLRGFGRSTNPAGPYSHRDDLLAVMRQLGVDKAYVAGSSMGGRIALDFALENPQQLKALVLVNPVVSGWEWSPEWLSSYAPVIRAAHRGEISAAKAAWLANPIFTTTRANAQAYAQLRKMVDDYSGWHFTHADPARTLAPPALAQLTRLQVPSLMLTGEQDLPDFLRMAQLLERDTKMRRQTLTGVGHMANLEAPQRVNEALQSFLSAAL